MPITLAKDVLDYDNLKDQLINDPVTGDEIGKCTHPAGHCFGSDGGSGIPKELKVEKGRGGEFEVNKLSQDKNNILKKYNSERCQYCLKYFITGEKKNEEAIA